METLTFNGTQYTVDHAAKGTDYIHGYDADGVLVVAFDGVTDFSGFTYSGSYMTPSDCLAEVCNDVKFCGGHFKTRGGEDIYRMSANHFGCYYRKVDGVIEWVNPPMELGTEYRTTERWNGKVVYMKCVNCGKMPVTSEKSIAHGIAGTPTFLSARVMAGLTGDTHFELTKCEGDSVKISGANVVIKTLWNAQDYQAYAFLKYVKD